MPKLQVTVPHELYDAMKTACGEPYADSYLSGATLEGGRLLPRTRTAWGRLKDNFGAMGVLRKQKINLVKPPIFQG